MLNLNPQKQTPHKMYLVLAREHKLVYQSPLLLQPRRLILVMVVVKGVFRDAQH